MRMALAVVARLTIDASYRPRRGPPPIRAYLFPASYTNERPGARELRRYPLHGAVSFGVYSGGRHICFVRHQIAGSAVVGS